MSSDKYLLQQKIVKLREALESDPTKVEVASSYWNALASFGGHDVRSGGFVIEAFRRCALASREGVVALACAYKELFDATGEKPNAELFDKELIQVLKARGVTDLREDDRKIVKWVLNSIE